VDPDRWGVHVWLADPAVVNARVSSIRSLLKQKERVQHFLKIDSYQQMPCQEDSRIFLGGIQSQLIRFRDYDPFHQAALLLPGNVTKPGSLRVEMLAAASEPGEFSVQFDLNQHLDLSANPHLNRLSVALAIEPIPDIHAAPLRNPTIVALQPDLRFPVAKDVMDDAAMLGKESLLLRPTSGAYQLWRLGEIKGMRCGSQALLIAPAFWLAPDNKEENKPDGFATRAAFFKTQPQEGIQLRFYQGTLAIQRGNEKKLVRLNLASAGELGFELIDFQKAGDRHVLLMEIDGYSRPGVPLGYCGGGIESNLVCVVLGRNLEAQKQSAALIGSCFENIDGTERNIEVSGLWTWKTDSGERIVQYNPLRPLEGLIPLSTPKGDKR
jgi:hypothetical protein